MRRSLALSISAVAVFAVATAEAQTRFSLQGGVVVPLGGEFESLNSPSLGFGLKAEVQPTNAIGQRKLLSFFGYFSYAELDQDPKPEEGSQARLFGAGGGARFYSKKAPLFLGAGLGYAKWRPGGDLGDVEGLDIQVQAGILVPLWFFLAEVEATAHEVVADNDDYQFATGMLGVAMPF